MQNYREISELLLKKTAEALNATEQHVLKHFAEKRPISRNISQDMHEKLTFGQKIADKVAAFGGSWPFIILFLSFLVIWISFNAIISLNHHQPFDPFPFILLNLFLSMIAAIQAPVIMMSQNRQSEHDRKMAQHDYEVNLKVELEVMALHQKIEEMKNAQLNELILLQRKQLDLMQKIIDENRS